MHTLLFLEPGHFHAALVLGGAPPYAVFQASLLPAEDTSPFGGPIG